MRSTSSDGSAARWGGGVGAGVVAFAAVTLVVLPQNYVALDPFWKAIAQVATLVGGIVAILMLMKKDKRSAVTLLLVAAFFAMVASFQGVEVWTTAYMLAPFAIGLAASPRGLNDRRFLVLLWAALLVLSLSVAVDAVAGAARVASLFGDVYRVTGMTESRPRGLMGQPVPTAIAVAIVTVAVVRLSSRIRSIGVRRVSITAAIAAGAFAVIYTGTRSALIVLALGLLVNMLLPIRGGQRANRLISFMAFALMIAVVLWLWPRVGGSFSQLRAFSFDSLEGTDSAQNRQYALTIFDSWLSDCNFDCKLVGSGPRDLQHQLLNYIGFNGLTTVDNLYVTLLWDFGVVGLLVFISPGIIALRRLLDRRPSVALASLVVVLVYISGFFFDTLYTIPFVVILGFFFGSFSRARDGESDGARVSTPSVLSLKE